MLATYDEREREAQTPNMWSQSEMRNTSPDIAEFLANQGHDQRCWPPRGDHRFCEPAEKACQSVEK